MSVCCRLILVCAAQWIAYYETHNKVKEANSWRRTVGTLPKVRGGKAPVQLLEGISLVKEDGMVPIYTNLTDITVTFPAYGLASRSPIAAFETLKRRASSRGGGNGEGDDEDDDEPREVCCETCGSKKKARRPAKTAAESVDVVEGEGDGEGDEEEEEDE